MSNSVAHIAVARELLFQTPGLVTDSHAYYLGSVAPDTISSKPGCLREDKKRVHLRGDIRDADWLTAEKMAVFQSRVEEFVRLYIRNAPEGRHRDFAVGYLVHLLTDKWNHKTIRQKMLKLANADGILESHREFYHWMVNDLEALDHHLLRQNPELSRLFIRLMDGSVTCSLPGYIEKEYIESSLHWWKHQYLPVIENRTLLHITETDIDEFIALAAKEIASELKQLL